MKSMFLSLMILMAIPGRASFSQEETGEEPVEKGVVRQEPVNPPADFYSLSFKSITGETFRFDQLKGKKVLIVNTASKCGYTPQFEQLEELSNRYKEKLIVIGFPSDNFGSQEFDSNEEIEDFCKESYGVTFLMMEKSSVKGDNANRIYKWLSSPAKNGWNSTEPLKHHRGNRHLETIVSRVRWDSSQISIPPARIYTPASLASFSTSVQGT